MKLKSVSILFLLMLIVSCQNDNKQLIIEQQKEAQKKEVVFKSIENGWEFDISPATARILSRGNCKLEKIH